MALARALVLKPSVLLLDEPLGALDAKLRRSLKVELKALQEQVGITFLYVTHDQEEALTMSDRLAVMRDGQIVQIGAPHEVYEEPADTYVADFLGVSNLMEVDVVSRGPGSRCRSSSASPCWRSTTAATTAPDRARGDQAGAGPGRGVRHRRPEPDPGHGRAAGLPGVVHPGAPAAGARGRSCRRCCRTTATSPLQLAQGTPVHAYLAPDALRVLRGSAQGAAEEDELRVTSAPAQAG